MIKSTLYPPPPERTIIGVLAPQLQSWFAVSERAPEKLATIPQLRSWFADTVSEPAPEKLLTIIRQMDTKPPAVAQNQSRERRKRVSTTTNETRRCMHHPL
jgi:hypothetical protein